MSESPERIGFSDYYQSRVYSVLFRWIDRRKVGVIRRALSALPKDSLIVDIGAGTTDMCLVRGYYPTPDDQVSYPVAGDAVDNALSDNITRRWPDLKLSRVTITKLKEQYSFVGDNDEKAKVKLK